MKYTGLLFLGLVALVSCSPTPGGGHDHLGKNSMAFNQEGADFGECGIVSQFETGRASASQVAGGG